MITVSTNVRLLAILLLMAAAFMLLLDQSSRVQQQILERSLAREQETGSKLIEKIMVLTHSSLQSFANDYSRWDDMVDFIKSRDANWAKINLEPTLTNFENDVIWVCDTSMTPIYGIDNQNGRLSKEFPLTNADRDSLRGLAAFAHFHASVGAGIIELQQAPVQPTADTLRRTPAQGYLIVGRLWSEKRLEAFAELAGATMSIADRRSSDEEYAHPSNEVGTVIVRSPLADLRGNAVAFLRARIQLSDWQNFRGLSRTQIRLIVGFVVVTLLVLSLTLFYWVSKPISRVSHSLQREDPGLLGSLLTRRTDFGRLARLVDESVRQKRELLKETIERQQAEAAARESERFARSTVDALAAHLAILDQSGTILTVNRAWRRFAENNSTTLSGLCEGANYLAVCDRATGPSFEGAAEFARGIRAVLNGELEEFKLEYPCHSPSEKRWFIGRVTRFPNDGDLRVVVAHEDITERMLGEEALKESEQRHRDYLTNTPYGVFAVDERGRFVQVNPSACRLTGYDEQELLTMGIRDLVFDNDRELSLNHFRDTVSKGRAYGELPYRTKSGERRWWSVSAVKLSDTRFLSFCNDVTERIRAEEALRTSQQMIEGIINAIPVRVFWKDRNLVYLGCNTIFAQDAGFDDPKDVVGKDDTLMSWRELAEAYRADDRLVIESGSPKLLIEEPQTTPDGRTITLLTSKIPLRDHDGEIIGVLGTYMDVTDQKLAAEAVREQLRFLQVILDAIPNPVYFKGLDGRYQGCNRAFEVFTGKQREDIIGRSAHDLVTPEQAQRYDVADHKLLESGGTQYYESAAQFLDGRKREVAFFKAPFTDANEKIAGIVGTILDITERKQMEDALRLSEAEHRMLFDHAAVGITYVDLERRVLMMNALASEQLSGKASDFVGEMMDGVLPPGLVASFVADVNRVTSENISVESELCFQTEKGTRWYLANFCGLREENGTLVGVQIITTDITDRKEAEATLKSNAERMQTLLSLDRMDDAEPKQIISFAIEEGIRLTGSRIGYLASLDESEQVLTMEYWSRDAMQECELLSKPIIYQLDETGLWGEAVRQRKPIITNDYAAPNPLKRGYPKGHVNIIRHMNVPIFDGEKIVAVAGVGNKETDYTESDTRQLQLLLEAAWRIVDRARAESALRESEERFRNLVRSQGEGVGIVDTEERFTFANPAAEKIFGVRPGTLVGRCVTDFVEAEGAATIRAQTADRATGVDASYELEIVQEGGEHRAILVTATPQYDESGVFQGSFGVFRDITDRKRAEEELRKLSQAVEQSPTSVVITDVSGTIEYVNPRFCELTGYDSAEVVGKNPRILKSGMTPAETYQDLWSTITTGRNWSGFFLNRKKSGELFWERANISGIRNPSGEITHYIAVKEDITEQKRIEEERSRFMAVIDNVPEAIVILNADGTIMYANRAFGEICGTASDSTIGDRYESLVRRLCTDPAYSIPWSRMKSGESVSDSITQYRKDGKQHLIDQTFSPIRDQSGSIANYLVLSRDVTEERELEIRARWADERLRLSIDGMVDGLTLWDAVVAPDGSVKEFLCSEANPAALFILGRDRNQVIGHRINELIAGQQDYDLEELFHRVHDKGRPAIIEHMHVVQNEARQVLTVHVWAIGTGVACHLHDSTQRLDLEAQLRQAQKLEAVGSLAAGIAHEINTPIQFVGDNIRFLADSFAGVLDALDRHRRCREQMAPLLAGHKELQELRDLDKAVDIDYLKTEIPLAVEQSLEGVGRVSTIVRAMKDFSHINEREMVLADINQMLDTTLTVAKNELKYVADVVRDFADDIPPVECFRNDLNQVFLNLLVNAAHAIADVVGDKGGQKGTISVSTRRDGDEVIIAIADTGSGIPENIRDRVFDHFFTTKEVGKGTGQGLSIARSIVVEKHKGAITFDTEVGKGTTFRIRLPISRKEVPNAESQHPVRG